MVEAMQEGAVRTVPAPAAGREPGRGFRRLVVPLGLLVLWQFVSAAGIVPASSLPSPSEVARSWWTWVAGVRTPLAWYSGTWLAYVWLSARRVLISFALAGSVGVALGVLIGWYALAEDLFDGLINFLRAIPMTAWLPLAVFFFGIHEPAAIFLIALGTFYPVVVNAAAGAKETRRILIRAALMLGTHPRRLLVRVVLPSALPSIFTGLRVGMGIAWVLVIVAEMLAVQGGLGYALWSAYQFGRMDLIIAAMLTVGTLGLGSDRLIYAVRNHTLRWARGQ